MPIVFLGVITFFSGLAIMASSPAWAVGAPIPIGPLNMGFGVAEILSGWLILPRRVRKAAMITEAK